jgi:hypothetical protein
MNDETWRTMARTSGVCGVVGMVLLFAPIIAISTRGEPGFEATQQQTEAFFRNSDVAWVHLVGAVSTIGMLVLLWFLVGLATLLRRWEGEPAWRSTVALVSSSLLVAYSLIEVSWSAATIRGDELDPALTVYAFDVGNLGFANTWLAGGSFAVATGWVLYDSEALPSWWAWWVIGSGVGLALSRFVWQEPVWFPPYFAFWAWVMAFSIRLIRRPDPSSGPAGSDLAGGVVTSR